MVFGPRLIAAIALTMIACAGGYAESSQPGPDILGFILPGPDADASLQPVLRQSFTVQLARRKLIAQLAESDRPQEFKLKEALSITTGRDAQYLVLATYTTTTTECGFLVQVYDPASGELLQGGEASGRIDLSLDAVVAHALDVALAGIRFREAPAAVVTPVETLPVMPRETWKQFSLSVEAAPLFATGVVSEYAKIGFLAALTADYRLPIGTGVLEAGVLAGVCIMNATGAVTEAGLLVLPVGIDLRWVMAAGSFPGVTLYLGGGPALMSVTAAYLGNSMAKIVPYILAGLTLDLPFSPVFGMAFGARYVAFLESSLPIMAFAPTVSVYVQL
jgi:hypothetical protein